MHLGCRSLLWSYKPQPCGMLVVFSENNHATTLKQHLEMGMEKESLPPQHQPVPGYESEMHPAPLVIRQSYKGTGKLEGKTALITGGDSGIGRSVAVHFAREGADVAIIYLEEDSDALVTKQMVEEEGQQCHLIKGNIQDKQFCDAAVLEVFEKFGKINVLVNNAAEQHPVEDLMEMDLGLMEDTFQTNIIAMFYITIPVLRKMTKGDTIINTTSVTSYAGRKGLVDYSSTKGAITSFTRALSQNVAEKGIRVNGIAPGPIWTPLIPSTFPEEKVEKFGLDTPLGRPGQPAECGPAYVFLASEDASYITGQVIHINGGELVGA